MKKGMCFEMHLLLQMNAGLASEPGVTNGTVTHKGVLKPRELYLVWYLVRGALNSDLCNLEMLSQFRHWLGKLHFIFSEIEMLSSHCSRDRQPSKLWQISSDTFNSSYSRSGFLLTSFPLPKGLFLPVSLTVTYSRASPRGTQVCACSFFPVELIQRCCTSCYITSIPACPVPSVQKKQKSLSFLLTTLY